MVRGTLLPPITSHGCEAQVAQDGKCDPPLTSRPASASTLASGWGCEHQHPAAVHRLHDPRGNRTRPPGRHAMRSSIEAPLLRVPRTTAPRKTWLDALGTSTAAGGSVGGSPRRGHLARNLRRVTGVSPLTARCSRTANRLSVRLLTHL